MHSTYAVMHHCITASLHHCICEDYPQFEQDKHFIRCERCHTYDCICGNSDFDDYIINAVEICPDCNWSVKMIGALK